MENGNRRIHTSIFDVQLCALNKERLSVLCLYYTDSCSDDGEIQ